MTFDIAIFAGNEEASIRAGIEAIDRACQPFNRPHMSLLLNGTTDRTLEAVRSFTPSNSSVTVYLFPERDKANAFNWYFYQIREKTDYHIFIDGYTRIGKNALSALCSALDATPHATIASGIPIAGRSAAVIGQAVLSGGAISGQLFAIRANFIDRLTAKNIRLPLELYRGDPLLGSMAAHDLDSVINPWDDRRLIGVAGAEFYFRPLSLLRWQDITRQLHRETRQARGRLENLALKDFIHREGYTGVPSNATEMILNWLKTHRAPGGNARERFFMQRALRSLNRGRRVMGRGPGKPVCSLGLL